MNRYLFTVTLAASLYGTAHAQTPAEHGDAVFQKWCAPCHAPLRPNNDRRGGTMTLNAIYKGAKPGALEERADLVPELVRYVVRHGQNTMPPFRKTEISDADLTALAAYLSPANRKNRQQPRKR